MRIEHVVELQGKDVAQVTNALMSRATYTEFHLGCVGADAFGLRLERDDARLELLIDVSCDHVFDAETLSEVGFLSDSGDAFFTALAGKYGLR